MFFFIICSTSTYAFGECGSEKTDTEIATIINFSSDNQGQYVIYGVNKNNVLIKQIVLMSEGIIVSNRHREIYSLPKAVNPKHIAINSSEIAYISGKKLFVIDTDSDVFSYDIYKDKIIEESEIFQIKIIDKSIQLFSKQGKNDYFIYKISDNKKEKINFNFSPGTVINNFKIDNNCYLISGYIKDPFLNDQYAYFTQTELNGKMIWEKQKGESDAVTVGFDMQIVDGKHKFQYSFSKDDYNYVYTGICPLTFEKRPSAARLLSDMYKDRTAILLVDDSFYFFRAINNKRYSISINKLDFKNDTITKNPIQLIQNEKHPFFLETKNQYQKGDNFQVILTNDNKLNVSIYSFSGNGEIDVFKAKNKNQDDEFLVLPTEKSKFEKVDDNDEYLLLLYSKEKQTFINTEKWDLRTIDIVSLYLSLKTSELEYSFDDYVGFNENRNPPYAVIIQSRNRNHLLIPILIKIKGNNSKTTKIIE